VELQASGDVAAQKLIGVEEQLAVAAECSNTCFMIAQSILTITRQVSAANADVKPTDTVVNPG
jgi:hypothetical protein